MTDSRVLNDVKPYVFRRDLALQNVLAFNLGY
jgi:hypothetical protein